MKFEYIIYAPSYNQNSGGSIFLHELAHALINEGLSVGIWPSSRLPRNGAVHLAKAILRRPSLLWKTPSFKTAPHHRTPIAEANSIGSHTIVVYPEITLGNPLKAKNVVRWLLYRPGLKDPYLFGKNEMFFRAGEMSDIPELTGGAPDLFLWKLNPVYQNQNQRNRKGACFLVRKGGKKPRIVQTANAIAIDGLSHEEIARIFNQTEFFYSYDEASFYSQYAAICGCTSIVIPGLYKTREEWVSHHPLARFGVAYGLNDIEHAVSTRHLLPKLLEEQEIAGQNSVRNFIALTQARYVNKES